MQGTTDIIGWRETIALPDFDIASLPAKIDTGARTSALHAVDHVVSEVEGVPWVEFSIPLHNRRSAFRHRCRIHDEREIKNTGGVPERRLIVRTTLWLGHHRWRIEVSLANRARMEFDLILGRTAIRHRGVVVDPGRSWLAGAPTGRITRQPRSKSRAPAAKSEA